MLYFCLTGRYPFPGDTAAQKTVAHHARRPTPVRDLRPEVPAELQDVVDRLMAKRPEDRFPHVGAVLEALYPMAAAALPPDEVRGLMPPRRPAANRPSGALAPVKTAPEAPAAGREPARAETGARKVAAVGALVAVAVGGALVLLGLWMCL